MVCVISFNVRSLIFKSSTAGLFFIPLVLDKNRFRAFTSEFVKLTYKWINFRRPSKQIRILRYLYTTFNLLQIYLTHIRSSGLD